MVQVLTMPMMGNTMEIGLVVEWLVAEGESVSDGDLVVIVESEKASTEIEASQDGVLASIVANEGSEVPPGAQLGVILGPNENSANIEELVDSESLGVDNNGSRSDIETTAKVTTADETEEASQADPSRVAAAPGARKLAQKESLPLNAIDGTGPNDAVLISDIESYLNGEPPAQYVVAPPSVRRFARERGVSLSQVSKIVNGHRITEADVRRAEAKKSVNKRLKQRVGSDTEATNPSSYGLTVKENRPLAGMRRTIADRMGQSAREKPHVTLNRTVSAESALCLVNEFEQIKAEIGLTDVLVCAVTEALIAHPEFNAWFVEDTHILIKQINIGVAVDLEKGLVTPVLQETKLKTPSEVSTARAALTEAVLTGEFTSDDLQGGTFTITNLGMFGIDSFDPIINPPQVAILGVGRIQNERDDRIITLSLSFDHRVVDGADAARFLDSIAKWFTAPSALLNRRLRTALDTER